MSAKIIATTKCPSFVSFAPDIKELFAIACYELNSAANERSGALVWCDCAGDENGAIQTHTFDLPSSGVFRSNWIATNNNGQHLMLSLTNGAIALLAPRSVNFEREIMVSPLAMITSATASAMHILATDSIGQAHILDRCTHQCVDKWLAHTLNILPAGSSTQQTCEAWAGCFIDDCSQIVTTGGDDGRLKIWDRRCGTAVPTMTNRRHTAGVTFVSRLHNNTSDQLLLTGSYDEYVRLTDTRQFNATVAEICLGGGVWNLEQAQSVTDTILYAACMYGGWARVKLTNAHDFSVIEQDKFDGEKLIYGVSQNSLNMLVVSSFYDKQTYLYNHSENEELK